MTQLEAQPKALAETLPDCLFATILGFVLPFYLAGAGGDREVAQDAILDLIQAYDAATAAELDLIGRIIAFNAASLDNLRLSMSEGLSDAKRLRYRANAVALVRSAEQGRKALEAMQAKRLRCGELAAAARPAPLPASAPVNAQAPAAASPPSPTASRSRPAPAAYPVSVVEGDPAFAIDIEVMKRNAHAMIADLQARAKNLGVEAPQASIGHMALGRNQANPPGNGARSSP